MGKILKRCKKYYNFVTLLLLFYSALFSFILIFFAYTLIFDRAVYRLLPFKNYSSKFFYW